MAPKRAGSPKGAAASADASSPKGEKKPSSARGKSRKYSFGGTSRREMRLELLGENTPGPGSYLPASSFAKAASSSSMFRGREYKNTTSSFRSTSAQREPLHKEKYRPHKAIAPKPTGNEEAEVGLDFPGPGTHTPNLAATERNATNAAPHLSAKGKRFAVIAGSIDNTTATGEPIAPEPGPGSYETHRLRTLSEDTAFHVKMGSKQNPGFNIASKQHYLPHEYQCDADANLPGPGKYNTNTSLISQKDGHRSVFRPPTERKKNAQDLHRNALNKPGKSRRGKGKGGASADTVHV